jgi:hypothetical protein
MLNCGGIMPPKFQRHFTRAITTKAALLIKQIDYRAFTLEGFAFVSGHSFNLIVLWSKICLNVLGVSALCAMM